MDVIAHRGFADEGVENAPSTLAAAAARADAVEFDVRLSRDGEPVVFHDATVDRLTDASGPVDAHTAAELTSLTLAGTDETIPTLAAVTDRLSGPIVPELKTPDVTERVLSPLRQYPDPVLVSSFRPDALAAIPEEFGRALLCGPADPADPNGLPEGAITDVDDAVAFVVDLGGDAVHPHHSLCTADAVESIHGGGLAVNAWTIRSWADGHAMRLAGVDGVIADSPRYV